MAQLRAAMVRMALGSAAITATITVMACGSSATLPVEAGVGPQPTLPPPQTSLIPVINVVNAIGWPPETAPTSAPGTAVNAFATDLQHPRWLYVLPNGDVLVAETNAPPRPNGLLSMDPWDWHPSTAPTRDQRARVAGGPSPSPTLPSSDSAGRRGVRAEPAEGDRDHAFPRPLLRDRERAASCRSTSRSSAPAINCRPI